MIHHAILCWGEIVWDRFVDQHRLGGAPANVAYHLAALGRGAAMVSRVGSDPLGERALVALADAGVNVDLVERDPLRPTGVVEVELVAGEPHYQIADGCAWERIGCSDALTHACGNARAMYFGTLAQRGADNRAALSAALAARSPHCITVCDLNLRGGVADDILIASAGAADVLKLNELELGQLGRQLSIADPLRWLLDDRGVRWIALTRGRDGSRLVTSDDEHVHPGARASPGGDAVGAGDAFTAVLLHGILAGASLAEINGAANRYAAYVASQRGGMPPIDPALLASEELRGLDSYRSADGNGS